MLTSAGAVVAGDSGAGRAAGQVGGVGGARAGARTEGRARVTTRATTPEALSTKVHPPPSPGPEEAACRAASGQAEPSTGGPAEPDASTKPLALLPSRDASRRKHGTRPGGARGGPTASAGGPWAWRSAGRRARYLPTDPHAGAPSPGARRAIQDGSVGQAFSRVLRLARPVARCSSWPARRPPSSRGGRGPGRRVVLQASSQDPAPLKGTSAACTIALASPRSRVPGPRRDRRGTGRRRRGQGGVDAPSASPSPASARPPEPLVRLQHHAVPPTAVVAARRQRGLVGPRMGAPRWPSRRPPPARRLVRHAGTRAIGLVDLRRVLPGRAGSRRRRRRSLWRGSPVRGGCRRPGDGCGPRGAAGLHRSRT